MAATREDHDQLATHHLPQRSHVCIQLSNPPLGNGAAPSLLDRHLARFIS